ncbi:hypothetical protein Tco_0440207, partial [Tanacetum coccineum]
VPMAEEEGIKVVEEASIEEGVEEVLVLASELAREKRSSWEEYEVGEDHLTYQVKMERMVE